MTTQAPPMDASCSVEEREGRLYLAWRSSDPTMFNAIKDDLRDSFPRHDQRVWSAAQRAWVFPAHLRDQLGEWIASWFRPDAVTWQVQEPPRARSRERAHPGSKRPATMPAVGLDSAYRTLHLRKTAPIALVRAARRALATTVHSDLHGGSDDGMAAINHAADLIFGGT